MYRPKGKNLKNGRRNINQNEVITKNENLPPLTAQIKGTVISL